MRRTWITALGVLGAALLSPLANAADHRDGPGVMADETIDITDVYAWMSADGSKVYLVMDVQGANTGAVTATKFSNAALYAFHTFSTAKYGMAPGGAADIICQFDNAGTQNFQCWGPGGEYVTDVTGNKAGKTSTSGKMKVFAGLRDDPFFFNIRGFRAAAGAVKQVGGTLTFDAAGCPAVSPMISGLLVQTLASDGMMGPGKDDFGVMGHSPVDPMMTTNGNILSIVVAIDTGLVTSGGKIMGIWGSTNKPQ